jgi:hypothetical protein
MNRIITTGVTEPNILQPFTVKSLDFLQNTYAGILNAFAGSMYGNHQSTFYPIAFTQSDASANIIPDFYFFGGGLNAEIFLAKGADTTGFAGIIMAPDFTWDTTGTTSADPLTYTDGVARNTHRVRQYKIVNGTVLSGGCYQYTDLVRGWENTTFNFGTIAASAPWTGTCSYIRYNHTGRVELKGLLSTLGGGSMASALPAGFRPTAQKKISVTFKDDATYKSGLLIIGTDGVITFDANMSGSAQGVHLDGASFYLGW